MEIKHSTREDEGYFSAQENDSSIGKLEYSMPSDDRMLIYHTEVNTSHRGKGIGKQLVKKAVDYSRSNNLSIVPQCAFAKKVFQSTPEFQDVL